MNAAYEVFAKTELAVVESLPGTAEIPATTFDEKLGLLLDTPAWRRLANLIRKLNDEETIDLLACGWFGAGLYPTWRQSFEHAERMFAALDSSDTAHYGRHWRSGYARVMTGVEAVTLEGRT